MAGAEVDVAFVELDETAVDAGAGAGADVEFVILQSGVGVDVTFAELLAGVGFDVVFV